MISVQVFVCTVLSVFVCSPVNGSVDMFIDNREIRRILGTNSSILYYVQEGVINEYAMRFTVPVPANIPSLHFTWQSLTHKLTPYSIMVDNAISDAMWPPKLNISNVGYVPLDQQVFRIFFPCTGKESDEIDVTIRLNISTPGPLFELLSLEMRRKKICLKGCTYQETGNPEDEYQILCMEQKSVPRNDSVLDFTSATSTYAIAGSLCGLLVTIAVVGGAVYLRSRKGQNESSDRSSCSYEGNPNVFYRVASLPHPTSTLSSIKTGSYATIASFQKIPISDRLSDLYQFPSNIYVTESDKRSQEASIPSKESSGRYSYTKLSRSATPFSGGPQNKLGNYNSSHTSSVNQSFNKSVRSEPEITIPPPPPQDPADQVKELTFDITSLEFCTMLHEGTFGKVYHGIYRGDNKRPRHEILVKTVSEHASSSQVALFLAEGLMMYSLKHKNILSVEGVSVPENSPPSIIYPYMDKGNLKLFLKNCRGNGERAANPLLTHEVVDMAIHVVEGMIYLHRRRILHTDVSARNCVLDKEFHVKITDSSLSRDIFPDDYHCLGDNENRPIKWLALECLVNKHYTPASDVWGFGVLLWELATLAQHPYEEVNPYEMSGFLRDGYRLAQPLNCPDQLFTVMAVCWETDPVLRPSFTQLADILQDVRSNLGGYI